MNAFNFDTKFSKFEVVKVNRSNKLDYSKKLIKDYLINNFDLSGKALNIKINYLYKYLTSNRNPINKEIDFKTNGDIIINKVPVAKNYIYNCLENNIEYALNIVIKKHHGYIQYGINLNDLRQDCYLYYLKRRHSLPKRWLIAKNKYLKKTNRHLTTTKFLVNILQSYFRKKVNEYLYSFKIPSDVKNKFPEKAKNFQIRSNKNLLDNMASKNSTVNRNVISRHKMASLNIIGSESYFSEVEKYLYKKSQNLIIDKTDKELTDIEFILKKKILIDIWNLKLEGFKLSKIAENMKISLPLIKKYSAKINNLFEQSNY